MAQVKRTHAKKKKDGKPKLWKIEAASQLLKGRVKEKILESWGHLGGGSLRLMSSLLRYRYPLMRGGKGIDDWPLKRGLREPELFAELHLGGIRVQKKTWEGT